MEKSSLVLFLQWHLHKKTLAPFFNLGGDVCSEVFPFDKYRWFYGAESLKIGIHLLWVGDLTEVEVSELGRETLIRAMWGWRKD